jgi:ectoine hydroxylase-related dioxygenase (phytanoyl-CoA dioxygenase family)
MTRQEFAGRIEAEGYALLSGVLPGSIIPELKKQLAEAIEIEGKLPYQVDYGMVLMCSLYGGSLLNVLGTSALMEPFEWVLGEGCIIYAYTSSSMPPGGGNYSVRIHVDSPRLIPGYVTNMGATILLDHFTEENGATWYLPGSHTMENRPSEEYFEAHAERVVAPAGSVFYFNARLWHSGGQNLTSRWRHGLTINMCRPYMKQRIDIPRAMGHLDMSGVPDKILQKLGFLAQVPASYEEYYAAPHLRKYRQKTE